MSQGLVDLCACFQKHCKGPFGGGLVMESFSRTAPKFTESITPLSKNTICLSLHKLMFAMNFDSNEKNNACFSWVLLKIKIKNTCIPEWYKNKDKEYMHPS